MIITNESNVSIDETLVGDMPFSEMTQEFDWFGGTSDGVRLVNVDGGTVNLTVSGFANGLFLYRCKDLKITISSIHCGSVIRMSECENIESLDSNMVYSANCHVYSELSRSLNIHDNFMAHGCCNVSTGGIYITSTLDSLVENNSVTKNHYGNYWTRDGGGIYMEHGSHNNTIRHNTVSDSYLALQDNSGGHNIWEQNTLVNCDHSIDITNAAKVENGIPEYFGNLLVHTPEKSPRKGANGRQVVIL